MSDNASVGQHLKLEKKDIVILTDFEEGHFFPLFKIARNLEDAGYSVCFIAILDTVDIIEKNGFNCIPIFQEIFPRGYVEKLRKNNIGTKSISPNLYLQSIVEEFDKFMPIIQPEIVFTSFFFSLTSLIIHTKFKVKQVLFHTFFPQLLEKTNNSMRQAATTQAIKTFMELTAPKASKIIQLFEKQNRKFKNFDDMLSPIRSFPHVMLCPKQLNITEPEPSENDIYLGPNISSTRKEQSDFVQKILLKKGDKKILYVSMGSQTKEYPKKAEHLFNTILEAMKSDYLKDFHLILSLGSESKKWNLIDLPENADVFAWVPQLEVLKLATIAVIHGGLGSVKECIYFGVPMLVVPMGRDQFDNASRIEHHQIGSSLGIDNITVPIVTDKLIELLRSNEIRENILQMQHVFQEMDEQKNEVKLVQSLLEPITI